MIQKNLALLKEGESALVEKLDSSGSIKRRLLDLGVVEGTKIHCVHKSPFGDPVAYAIRGAIIALRQEDAREILVN